MELPLDKVQNLIDALNQLNKVELTSGNDEEAGGDGNYERGQTVDISKYREMAADEVLTLKDILYYKPEDSFEAVAEALMGKRADHYSEYQGYRLKRHARAEPKGARIDS